MKDNDETIALSGNPGMSAQLPEEGPSPGPLGYLVRLLLLLIPVVNVMAALVMGFASSRRETRNFGRGALIFLIIFTLACVGLGVWGGLRILSLLDALSI